MEARRRWGPAPGLLAMARPRGGDFDYSLAERHRLEVELAGLARAGADGVVTGMLSRGRLHLPGLRRVARLARDHGLQLTFHRAFDALTDPLDALDELVELGFRRILSSGTPWASGQDALRGRDALIALRQHAAGRLELVVAGAVNGPLVKQLRGSLKPATGRLSWHSHSGVRLRGRLNPHLLRALLREAGAWV